MVTHEVQQQDNWCWAACFRMACSYFGKPCDSQCTIVQRFLELDGCCPPGNNPACDKSLDESSVAILYSSAALRATAISISDVSFRQAIQAGSLILVMLRFDAGFHFVLLSGCDALGDYVTDDPKYGTPITASFAEISTAYGSGQIANAWIVSQT